MVKPMPEDTFNPIYGGSKATFYAPNFVGGTGDPSQPGQATAPGPSEDTEPKPTRPQTPLGSVTFGGGGGGVGRRTPLGPEQKAEIARRGQADLSFENARRLAGNVVGLMSDPVMTGAASIAERELGLDQGTLGGLQDFEGYRTVSPDQVNDYGAISDAGGGGNGNQGGGGFGGPGRSGGTFGGGTSNTANGNSNSLGGGGLYRRGGTIVPRYAGGGTVGRGGGDGGGGPGSRNVMRTFAAAAPAAQPRPLRGVGPTDGGMNPRMGPKPTMAGMGMRGYADGGDVVAPAAVPDDGVTDNVPIMADEGEFVITRDAAVAYDPAVLEAINDPQMAPIIEQLIADYLAEVGGMGAEAGMQMDDGSEVLPPAQAMPQLQRPQSPLGRMRA